MHKFFKCKKLPKIQNEMHKLANLNKIFSDQIYCSQKIKTLLINLLFYLFLKISPMDFLEEIEFFGFVPVTYVNNLIKNTTDRAEEILKDENPVTRKEIITSLNKNFQIFEVFVLKSIFKFPDSFSFERKVTDFNCDTEINNLICELTGILEEEENLKKEIFIKEKDLELKILEGKEYDILLESEEKMKKLTEKVKEMEKIHLEAESSLKKLNKLTGSLKRRNQLTEFKNLKDAFWEKEKGFLFENISLAQIQFYNKNI